MFLWLKQGMMQPMSMSLRPGIWCLICWRYAVIRKRRAYACVRACKLTADWQRQRIIDYVQTSESWGCRSDTVLLQPVLYPHPTVVCHHHPPPPRGLS